MAHVVCNESGIVWPNGLPPGWCMQGPISDVSLWYNKRHLIIKNTSNKVMRATIRRRLINGQEFLVKIDVNSCRQTDQVVWLAGADTGSVELLDVMVTPDDDSLSGLNDLSVEEDVGVDNICLVRLHNRWSVPLYVHVEFNSNQPSGAGGLLKHVIEPKSRMLVFSGSVTPKLKWRAAVLQRTDFYSAWPPTAAVKISPAAGGQTSRK
ncbi:hypothetical protein [Pseudomonas sp. YL-218 TE3947]|uniref:hypothetical protein n=1 Tax=Pseudomonas TaxID=286 RepID=UPI003D1F8085